MKLCAGILMAMCLATSLLLLGLFFRFSPSALPEPGHAETFVATTALHILIWRESRRKVTPSPPADRQASVDEGDKLYGVECADCHGQDGHSPTDQGRWMYPRSANLVSSQVQRYSDAELFWILKNGIRLSGMPAFARVETDDHIWSLVEYLRTLPSRDTANNP
jgi:mono/diheme cytochrome c family protein